MEKEEAMKILKDFRNKSALFSVRTALDTVFPELAESEDERIRKALIDFFQDWHKTKPSRWSIPVSDVITWLEKQGEQKSTLPKWKYKKDNTPLLRDSIILNKYGGVAKSPSGAIISDAWVLDYDELAKLPKEELDKQEEKKPIVNGILTAINCNELFQNCKLPKFNVGNWLIGDEGIFKITRYEAEYGYELTCTTGYVAHFISPNYLESNYKLWTIANAKPGDVLASGHLVFIFKAIHGVWLNCHCSAHNDGSFIADSYDLLTNKYFSEVHPASKEQRDLLFKKMKEAGYEWDAEKKELRKIEQKLANSAKISKNDTLLDLLQKMPSYITVDGIDYYFVMNKTSFYTAYYKALPIDSPLLPIFGMTAFSPIDLLTEMLEHLKEKGLLE